MSCPLIMQILGNDFSLTAQKIRLMYFLHLGSSSPWCAQHTQKPRCESLTATPATATPATATAVSFHSATHICDLKGKRRYFSTIADTMKINGTEGLVNTLDPSALSDPLLGALGSCFGEYSMNLSVIFPTLCDNRSFSNLNPGTALFIGTLIKSRMIGYLLKKQGSNSMELELVSNLSSSWP